MECPTCHQETDRQDRFCASCGRPLMGPRASHFTAVLTDDFDIDELGRLQQEKMRVTRDLQRILEMARDTGQVSDEEQQQYQELRSRWGDLAGEITRRMDYLEARKVFERRKVNRRHRDRRQQNVPISFPDRRTGDRRGNQRRSGDDRRYPFD